MHAQAPRLAPPPAFASGRLWAPVPPPPDTVPVTAADSALARLDEEILARGRVHPRAGPQWRTTILGREFALDPMWTTIAGVKMPTMLLGLLPLGDYAVSIDQSKAAQRQLDRKAEIDRYEAHRPD